MLPWTMIAYLSVTSDLPPQQVQFDFGSAAACLFAGKQISTNITAVGFCIDKFTGKVVMWSSAEDEAAPSDMAPTPLRPQRNPLRSTH